MAQSFEKRHDRRIIAMIILVAIVFVFGAMRVFEFQVVQGEKHLANAEKFTDVNVSIVAARGEIVDRNGVPLTQNKAVFNVDFDYTFLDKNSENEVAYKLIKLFESLEEEWIDELPISKTQPYTFLENREADIVRLKEKLKLNQYTSAEDCMENLFERYGIKKYKDKNGKCTHCGLDYDECDFEGYTEYYSRLIAGVRYQMLLKDFSAWTTRFTFAEDIAPATVALIREFSHELKGIEVVERATRTYLSGDVASHLVGSLGPIYAEEAAYYKSLGYKDNEIVGKSGIERVMETDLRGTNGVMTVIKNTKGEIVDVVETKAPVAGNTVQLTLDLAFQKDVQEILAEYIASFNETNKLNKHAEAAAIVVLDVKNGGVLASVSYPYFDINDFQTNYAELLAREDKPLFNRALNGTYRPGSTFKPVVAAAGLTEQTITDHSTVFCDGRYHFWSDYQPGCLQLGHKNVSLNVMSALQHSCNIFFYDTGRILGINKVNEYARYFGLGVETGLELNDNTGNLSSPDFSAANGATWNPGNVVQASIGQMDTAVTPLQMAIEASTLANRGTRYNAHLVKNILSNDKTKVISTKEAVVASQFPMSNETYDTITKGLIMASYGVGAPNHLTDLGYDVAVKTGTPEVSTTKTNNAFIAYAPTDEPEIAIACMVEDGYSTIQMVRKILLAYEKAKLNWK